MVRRLALVLGNCLFPDHSLLRPDDDTLFFMAEDLGLCTHYRYHKHKLILFLSAMRQHRDSISSDYKLVYWELKDSNKQLSFEDKLTATLEKNQGIKELVTYDIEDRFFAERIREYCRKFDLVLTTVDSPSFITNHQGFKKYLGNGKKPFMHNFYKFQRRQLNILLEADGQPTGGEWSYDHENRKSLPKDIVLPENPNLELSDTDKEVIELVEHMFPSHPGSSETFNWHTSREGAMEAVQHFLHEKLEQFGPYEDAIDRKPGFLFHSTLSPYLNLGLITPSELIETALQYHGEHNVHLPSVEGFVRQIIGWREFVRGIYNNFDLESNYFGHHRKMKDCWYDGTTGIPPLDDCINKVQDTAYNHHIERLMILGNIMLMTGLHPKEVYGWFMEMYVDNADWVMAPNVYGMSQFAEGGIFATKPYICGSNYIRKMSNYSKGPWCDVVDGLYWMFIDSQQETFAKNHRMRMMISTLEKMGSDKKNYLFERAKNWIENVSTSSSTIY